MQRLDLGSSCIGATGAVALAAAIKISLSMQHLDLAGNSIKDEGAAKLAAALKVSASMQRLDLSQNSIEAEGAAELAAALKVSLSMQFLDLAGNTIRDKGTAELAAAPKASFSVQRLDLSRNDIGSQGAARLAAALEVSTSMLHLDLTANSIEAEGAAELAAALKVSTSMQRLGLSQNGIGSEGAAELALALKASTSMQSRILCSNSIGDWGTAELAASLKVSTSIQSLVLSDNSIGDEGATELAAALKVSDSIQSLDLTMNLITDKGASKLAGAWVERVTHRLPPVSLVLDEDPTVNFQSVLGDRLRKHMDETEKHQVMIIRLAACLVFVIIVGLFAWQNRAQLGSTCQRISERLFPETLDIPGLSDRSPRDTRVMAWVEMVSSARSATAAGVSLATSQTQPVRRTVANTSANGAKFETGEFKTGRPKLAAGGVPDFVKASPDTVRKRYTDPVRAVQDEWEQLEEEVYKMYMACPQIDKAKALSFLRYILFEAASGILDASNAGDGQTVVRDEGRGGMMLADFVTLPQAVEAGLDLCHVLALRIYTSSLFQIITRPFRETQNQEGFQDEHPVPVTVLLLHDALKKLRQLHLNDDSPYEEYWRGMNNLDVSGDFLRNGGTELGPMSTSVSKIKLGEYANSEHPLILRIVPATFMERGSDISWLSLYPGEREVLYPPLTYLEAIRQRRIKNSKGWVIDVRPHIN
ncbi:unnamed protein product [Prorocentrum cordatum]|uniref:NAD(P)(+)--arginine ADP-ribosyltransferase n=1 Tax=Prorocentrum cordatum TaxID=2364126 RepID=A0ABN9QV14_9DINO|nr:unnamed protein product [Polarella glacialis]